MGDPKLQPQTPVPIANYPSALSVAKSEPVRFFVNTAAQAAVEKVFASVPAGKRAVMIDVQGDDGHIAAVVAAKLDEHWTIALAADKTMGAGTANGDKGVRYEGVLRFAW